MKPNLRVRPPVALVILAVVLFPSVAFCADSDWREATHEHERKEKERREDPRGDFAKYSFKSVDEALKNPDAFWEFITAPGTPYIERRAAAVQAMKVLPFSEVSTILLPRLLAAQDELGAEFGAHSFGMELPRHWSRRSDSGDHRCLAAVIKRNILGHEWSVPEVFAKAKLWEWKPIPSDLLMKYPLTLDEEMQAPWPWQVQEALKDISSAVHEECRYFSDKTGRWKELLKSAMTLPIDTDDQALIFLRITRDFSRHSKTIPVMARWYAIGLDAGKPKSARFVAEEVGKCMEMGGMSASPEESRMIGDVIVIDILKTSKDREAIFDAAGSYCSLHYVDKDEKREGKVIPESPTAVKLITEAVLNPRMGDESDRVYNYNFLRDLLRDPPFTSRAIEREMDRENPDYEKYLQKIRDWYAAHKAGLEKAAATEAGELDRIRSLLKNPKEEAAVGPE